MGTSAQDKTTQQQSSAGAQANDQQLAANAAKNQQFSDQTRTTLFGTYNPTTNQYEGGTESSALNPDSLNTKNLTGAYANEYNTIANKNAQGAQEAVGTTMQNLASRGLGKTPAGFAADQQRKAYQDQTSANADAYSGLFGQQHGEAVDRYNNANSMLSNNSQGAANLSVSGNQAAAGNYSGLYGTASQQKQNALGYLGTNVLQPIMKA
jgi:hypothetical protein